MHGRSATATTGTGASVTHAYAAPGRYPVTLTVRDGAAVLGSATQTVSAYAPAAGSVAVRPRERPAPATARPSGRDAPPPGRI